MYGIVSKLSEGTYAKVFRVEAEDKHHNSVDEKAIKVICILLA